MTGTPTAPSFDDPRVQLVYSMLCNDDSYATEGDEHWEGAIARRIVAALSAQSPPNEPAPARDDFLHGVCVALSVLVASDSPVDWAEIVRTAGVDAMLNFAAFVEPDEWELAGFRKYAQAELGRSKPRKETR